MTPSEKVPMQRPLCPASSLPWARSCVLAASSPAATRSSGTRPASCSSPRQTQTASCPPPCWLSGRPWTETRAGESQGCSSGLKRDRGTRVRRNPVWTVASAGLTPRPRTHPHLLIRSGNILHAGPWAGHRHKETSAVTPSSGTSVQMETGSAHNTPS